MDSHLVMETGEILNAQLGELINKRKRQLAELNETGRQIDEVLLTMATAEGWEEDKPCTQ